MENKSETLFRTLYTFHILKKKQNFNTRRNSQKNVCLHFKFVLPNNHINA